MSTENERSFDYSIVPEVEVGPPISRETTQLVSLEPQAVVGQSIRTFVAREFLAIFLLLVFTGVIFGLMAVSLAESASEAEGIAQLLLPPLTGLVGTVIGYYFGTREYSSRAGRS